MRARRRSCCTTSAAARFSAAPLPFLLALALIVSLLIGGAWTPTSQAATQLFAWDTVAPVPQARFEAQGAAVGGKLYVLGGFYTGDIQATSRSDAYDLASNTWTRIADMPEPLTHAAQVVDGSTIYVLGGYVGKHPGPATSHVWRYNTQTNTWAAGPSLPAARGGGGAALIGRALHFYGGATRTPGRTDDTDHADHFILNLDGGTTWSSAAPMPNPRNHIGGIALGGKAYAIGGQHGHAEGTTNQAEVDVYDPASNTWQRVADLPLARGHISASTFVYDGRIIVAGGSVDDGGGGRRAADVFSYDPATNVWLHLPSLPSGRKTPVADQIGGKIVVSTGNGGGPSSTTWVGTLPDRWETGATMPLSLGEVAGGIIGNQAYIVGEGNNATLGYNLSTNTWRSASALAQRPFVGHHHTAEIVNGELYLFGGLNKGAGKVQIYSPTTNAWRLGADMPFPAGSSNSALIGSKVYVAGGIVGRMTTALAAVYDPATNTWASIAPMPQGRNHAAAATDGSRLYVFGGRGAGSGDDNVVANGFDTVQIYDPVSNTWQSSQSAGSSLAPLPQARGGTGKAVYAAGEFYVMGGETKNGTGATAQNVYNRVDIYNPATNTWRRGADMPTARHGIFPLLIGGRVYVAGGGTQAANSQASMLEIYNVAPAATAPPSPTPTSPPAATSTPAPTAAPTNVPPAATSAPTTTPTAPPAATSTPTGGPSIINLPLINADTNQPIAGYETLSDGVTLNLATLPTRNLSIRADTSPATIGSVRFGYDGNANYQTENLLPYAIAGDKSGNFNPWTPSVGSHTLTVTPYSGSNASGTAGTAVQISFTVVDNASPPTSTPAPTAAPNVIVARINAGGPAVTTGGVNWATDQFYSGGKLYTNAKVTAIAATNDDVLYLTEHSATSNLGTFSYNIPVPGNATYLVRLHFAEIYWGATGGGAGGAGKRVFSVDFEGTPVELVNYDINAAVGPMTAVVKEYQVAVTDGALTLDFSASVDQPKIAAIEVLTLP